MLTITERAPTPGEERELRARLAELQAIATSVYPKTLAASVAICGILCLATLGASDAPRLVIVAFWTTASAILTVWIARTSARDARRQAAILRAALTHGRVRATRITSRRVVEFEEIEDEGACYAFETQPGRVVFIHGQEFYADDTFPNDDFSIVEVLLPGKALADLLIMKNGRRLDPERRIAADVKDVLELPDHLAVISGDLATLEQQFWPALRRSRQGDAPAR